MSADGKLGPKDCLRTRRISGRCSCCGATLDVAHLAIRERGGPVCLACCPACNPPRPPQPEPATAGGCGETESG